MRKLLVLQKGFGVNDKDDISPLVPNFMKTVHDVFSLWSNIEKSMDRTDNYYVGTQFAGTTTTQYQNTLNSPVGTNPSEEFGGYANTVHESLNHKCYPVTSGAPISGVLQPDGSVALNPGYDQMPPCVGEHEAKRDRFISDLNDWVVQSMVDALASKGCVPKLRGKLYANLIGALTTLVSHISKDVSADVITGLYSVDTRVTGSAKRWENTILVQVAPGTSRSYREYVCMLFTQHNIICKCLDSYEIEQVLATDCIVNWKFGVASSAHNVLTFVFDSCRTAKSDQYKITMNASSHLIANVPHNVGMLVNHGNDFKFSVRTDTKDYILGIIQVNGERYPVTNMENHAMHSAGIAVEEQFDLPASADFRYYDVTISNITSDLVIGIDEMAVDPYLGSSPYLTMSVDPVVSFPRVAETAELAVSVEFSFNLNSTLVSGRRVRVYAIPASRFSHLELPPKYLRAAQLIEMPTGFGLNPYYRVATTVPRELMDNHDTVILRIVFEENSLWINRTVTVANRAFAVQMECTMGSDKASHVYIGVLNPAIAAWRPIVPMGFAFPYLTENEFPYFELERVRPADGHYELKTKEGMVVPRGLTRKETYNLKSLIGLPEDEENEENPEYYFATVLVPVSYGYDVPGGSTVVLPEVRVFSRVCGLFHMICASGAVSYTAAEDGLNFAIYSQLERPYINGVVEIPIVFGRQDKVIIDIPNVDVTLTIDVDLTINEAEDNGDNSENNQENPNPDNKGDDPVGEDKKDPENGDGSEENTGGSAGNETEPGSEGSETGESGSGKEETNPDDEKDPSTGTGEKPEGPPELEENPETGTSGEEGEPDSEENKESTPLGGAEIDRT